MSDDLSAGRISPLEPEGTKSRETSGAEEAKKYAVQQEGFAEAFNEWSELAAFNPLAMARRFETLETRTKKRGREEETEKTDKEKKVFEVKRLEEVSEQFERKNQELHARTLLLLRARISIKDSRETILKKVLEIYSDYSLADDALDFLIETSEGELTNLVRQAKEDLNTLYGREVRAGRNMAEQARAFSQQGLGSPTSLRDMYRDITGNPRDAQTLFQELSTNFNYDKMKTVIDFILHSLGADLKAKGPSISRGELHRFMTEARSLQAILGVYRFFKTRMSLVLSAFERGGQTLSSRITFETLARLFMKYLQERYPSADKVLQLAAQLGISEELLAQIILYTQMRDAIRQIAPKLFRSEQHKQDVLMSFIEALEDLEEELEEKEEKEQEEEEEK